MSRHPWTTALLGYSFVITLLWGLPDGRQHEDGTPHPAAQRRERHSLPTSPQYHRSTRQPLLEVGMNDHCVDGTATRLAPLDWSQIESKDFGAYVANLRNLGCPEGTIRRIVSSEVRESFDHDRRALLDSEPISFWDGSYGEGEMQTPEFQAIAQEESRFLTELLGEECGSSLEDPTGYETLRFGQRLAAKKQGVQDILSQTESLREEILAATGEDGLSEEQQQRFSQIEIDKEQALATLLSSEEREDFEIRNSALANELRSMLREEGREVTEAQFRQMFRMRQDLARQIELAARSGGETGEAWAAYQAGVRDIIEP